MEAIFVCRDKIASIYKNCEFLFKILAKFIFAFLTLSYLTNNLGYYDVLNIMSIRLFLSVVCAFIPVSFVVLVMGLVAVLHLVKLSMILGALSAVVFLIIYFLYLRFAPAQGIFMLAVAVLSPFHLHYAVAFVLGMFYSPVTLIPVGLTIVLMRFVQCVVQAAPIIGDSFEMEVILAGYQSVIDGLMDDKSMILLIAALAIIIVLTYIISQMPFDYSWYVAIAVAAIVNIVVIIAGNGILGAELSVGSAVIGTVAGAVIAAFLQFMRCVVDYPKKEFVQFEDDEYYYYVKAIPKIGANTDSTADSSAAEMPKKKVAKKASDGIKSTMPQEAPPAQDTQIFMPENSEVLYDAGGFENYDFYDNDQSKF